MNSKIGSGSCGKKSCRLKIGAALNTDAWHIQTWGSVWQCGGVVFGSWIPHWQQNWAFCVSAALGNPPGDDATQAYAREGDEGEDEAGCAGGHGVHGGRGQHGETVVLWEERSHVKKEMKSNVAKSPVCDCLDCLAAVTYPFLLLLQLIYALYRQKLMAHH